MTHIEISFKYTCTDCGTDNAVYNVHYDFNEIDICMHCLEKRKDEERANREYSKKELDDAHGDDVLKSLKEDL